MAKKNEATVTVVNTGVCVIVVGGESLLPEHDIEVAESMLDTSAFEYLIARGELSIKNDMDATAEIAKRVKERKQKDPTEGKSQAELENGGTI